MEIYYKLPIMEMDYRKLEAHNDKEEKDKAKMFQEL